MYYVKHKQRGQPTRRLIIGEHVWQRHSAHSRTSSDQRWSVLVLGFLKYSLLWGNLHGDAGFLGNPGHSCHGILVSTVTSHMAWKPRFFLSPVYNKDYSVRAWNCKTSTSSTHQQKLNQWLLKQKRAGVGTTHQLPPPSENRPGTTQTAWGIMNVLGARRFSLACATSGAQQRSLFSHWSNRWV